MGVQWHPEAYNEKDPKDLESGKHRSVLLYMAKAGDAYAIKRQALEEMRSSSSFFFARMCCDVTTNVSGETENYIKI